MGLLKRHLPFLGVAAAVVVFLAVSAPILDRPFGNSHDGYNGAQWGLASRAVRDDGFIASRAGGILPHGVGTYANHPPLIIQEAVWAELIAGERPAATRAPAWIGSIATIILLAALIRALGCSGVATAVGTVLTATSAMFLTYGSMLDTPVTSLPFALAFLLVWHRQRSGRGGSSWVTGTLAALCVVAGWEAALLVGVISLVDVRAALRLRRPLPSQIGFAVGLPIVVGWMYWVYGGFGRIFRQLGVRSGVTDGRIGAPPTPGRFLESQGEYTLWFFSEIGIVLLVAAFVALFTIRRLRPVGPILAGVTLAYPLIMWEGATRHTYWNFWWVAVLGVGGAAVVDLVRDRVDSPIVALGGIGAVVVIFAGLNIVVAANVDGGHAAGDMVAGADLPSRQDVVIGGPGIDAPPAWVSYGAGLPFVEWSEYDHDDFPPDAAVLVACDAVPDDLRPASCGHTSYAFVPLGSLDPGFRE